MKEMIWRLGISPIVFSYIDDERDDNKGNGGEKRKRKG